MFNAPRGRARTGVIAAAASLALVAPLGGAVAAGPQNAGTVQMSTSSNQRLVESSDFGSLQSKVRGTYNTNGTVRGWFKPKKFDVRDGQLVAVGKLHAVLVRGDGTVRDKVDQRIVIPVKEINGLDPMATARSGAMAATSCSILDLVLGPLDLDLLGLEVHLNRVHLVIEATPGPGNLLGNLLCAVAGLLDNTGVLTELSQILSSIAAILRQ